MGKNDDGQLGIGQEGYLLLNLTIIRMEQEIEDQKERI